MKAMLLLLSVLLFLADPVSADMTGSYGQIVGPGMALPGDTATFIFYIFNGSEDGEATSSVHFRFPETFHLVEAWYDDGGLGWEFDVAPYGAFDERVVFFDAGDSPGIGEIQPASGGYFYVTMFISSNTNCGVYDFIWKQYGDKQGAHPHWMRGSQNYDVCGIATESSDWSSVKSLY